VVEAWQRLIAVRGLGEEGMLARRQVDELKQYLVKQGLAPPTPAHRKKGQDVVTPEKYATRTQLFALGPDPDNVKQPINGAFTAVAELWGISPTVPHRIFADSLGQQRKGQFAPVLMRNGIT
jgi:hypothetical protein